MRPLLRVILSPWATLTPLVVALLILILGFLLRGTLHVFTVAHVTLIQYGDSVIIGGRGLSLPTVQLWQVGLVLALPGIGWGLWWLIHVDSKKSNP